MDSIYVLDKAISSYINSNDPIELIRKANECAESYKSGLYNNYRYELFNAIYSLRIKAYLIRYFSSDLSENDDYKKVLENCDKIINRNNKDELKDAEGLAYRAMDAAKGAFDIINSFFCYQKELEEEIKNEDSKPDVLRLKLDSAIASATNKLATIKFDGIFREVNESIVSFISSTEIITKINNTITKKSSDLLTLIEKYEEKTEATFLSTFLYDFDYARYNFKYMPLPEVKKGDKLIILHSPMPTEIDLFSYSFFKDNNLPFKCLDVHSLHNMDEKDLVHLFMNLGKFKTNVYIANLQELDSNLVSTFYKALLEITFLGSTVIIGDYSSKKEIYNHILEIFRVNNYSRFEGISEEFLTMPEYEEVIDLFLKLKMIDNRLSDEAEAVKNEMPLMGFFGMNMVINAFNEGNNWVEIGKYISSQNRTLRFEDYIKHIDLDKFIDSGWNEEAVYHGKMQVKRFFNYASVPGIDPGNLRKIFECPRATTFDKIGIIIDYTLRRGMDTWDALSDKTKVDRINTCIKALYLFYDINFDVVVEVVEKINKEDSTFGVCVDEGRIIQLSLNCIKRYDVVSHTIAHETFHALQFKCCRDGYMPWLNDICVTSYRVEEWKYNVSPGEYLVASDNYKHYRFQVLEADAFAFENDCFDTYHDAYKSIKFD